MDANHEADRLFGVVLDSLDLDTEGAPPGLARRAFLSRTHFHRLFRALSEESPARMRRRLLLERAAWQLGRTSETVTGIALEAGYGSLEAFTRAFRRAFGVSPSLYRRTGPTHFRLPASNGIHFGAPASSRSKGASNMDLFDRFAGHDSWHTRRLLRQAAQLTPEQLDRPLPGAAVPDLPWEKQQRTLRDLLERAVETKEIWTAALAGRGLPQQPRTAAARTPDGLLARYDKVDAEFLRILGRVRDLNAWDDTFVDALCEPAETFTFGGMFAHFITFATYRRLATQAALRDLGVNDGGLGCPTEYEAEVAPWRAEQQAAK